MAEDKYKDKKEFIINKEYESRGRTIDVIDEENGEELKFFNEECIDKGRVILRI